ncbi:MAG TPA: TolC family outer membrane protein [Rhodanobacteraceae bacterium]
MKSRTMKLLPLAVALAVTPMLALAQSAGSTAIAGSSGETLMQAYQQALINDPTLAQQVASRNISDEGVVSSRASLLPSLSASWSIGQSRTYGGGGSQATIQNGHVVQTSGNGGYSRGRGWSVTLNQTILDFSKYANLSAAKAQAASADATYQANLQDLIIRVATAYFNVLTARDDVAFNQANVDALKRQYDQAEQRFKVGLSAITAVQDSKANYESAQAQLITAQNTLSDSREALTQITGHPVKNLEVLSDTLPMSPPTPNNLHTWVTQAKINNPNILAQQFNVEAADHSVSAARDARLPTLDASLGYSGKGANWAENGPYKRTQAGSSINLSVSVPIFSGGSTRAGIESAIYRRDSAQAALIQQRRQVVRNTRNYFRSVSSGISQVEAAKQALLSSESALKATQAGFLVGTETIVDVLLAQQTLMSSRQQYSQARHNFILNKLLLEQAAGTLSVDDLKHVSALLEPASDVQDKLLPAGGNAAAQGTNASPSPASAG